MRNIKYHNREYLRNNNLVLQIDENQVHFINGVAAVNATIIDGNRKENKTCSGIINEDYQEVFDDKYYYGDFEARKNLMFLVYNTNILRCGENDFIVTVRQGDDYCIRKVNKHIRINDMEATLINPNIGEYIKTSSENILICDTFRKHNKRLYNVAKGEHVKGGYDEISIIDGCPNCFAVKKHVNSLSEESSRDEDLYLTDDLYFQIDQDGNVVSQVFSERKVEFLDYGDLDINKYPDYRKQELVEESKKLKAAVYSLKKDKKQNK